MEALKILIDAGADVHDQGNSGRWNALMWAAAKGQTHAIGSLLSTDMSLLDARDAKGRSALDLARLRLTNGSAASRDRRGSVSLEASLEYFLRTERCALAKAVGHFSMIGL